MTTCRIEVDTLNPRRTLVAYFDTDVPPALAEQLRPVVDDALAQVRAGGLNLIDSDACLLLAAEVAQLVADGEAYEREAARRGVLAL